MAAEVGMAWRRIGQEDLIARPEPRAASSLTELAALLDWAEIASPLAGISAAARESWAGRLLRSSGVYCWRLKAG
ncbi:hypothetical protein ACFQU2_14445 [Siccirubricoccus deserti]